MKIAFVFLKKCIWHLDPLGCYRPLVWGRLDQKMGLNRSSFYIKVPEDKNLEHEQNVETSCALSKNHSEQKGFQAVRCQQVYYQKQNSQRCEQRESSDSQQAFQELCGSSCCHTWEKFRCSCWSHMWLDFSVCRGLPPMAYFQVAGPWDSSIVFWHKTFKLYAVREVHHSRGIALVLSCCLW